MPGTQWRSRTASLGRNLQRAPAGRVGRRTCGRAPQHRIPACRPSRLGSETPGREPGWSAVRGIRCAALPRETLEHLSWRHSCRRWRARRPEPRQLATAPRRCYATPNPWMSAPPRPTFQGHFRCARSAPGSRTQIAWARHPVADKASPERDPDWAESDSIAVRWPAATPRPE